MPANGQDPGRNRDRRAARLLRRTEVGLLLAASSSGRSVTVTGAEGALLFGSTSAADEPLSVAGPGGEPVLRVAAERPVGPVLAAALQALLALDDERRQIADEVLGLYREVNLLYELAETLTRTAGRDELASRMLAEVTRLVDADSAMVVIEQDGRQTVGAHLGHEMPPPAELDRARIDDDGALLVAPLSVGDERHGAIILRRSGSAFSAADAKLLGAVAAQAAGVLERVLEEERRAAAAAARERRLQEQIDELRIELDERRQAAQVAQITETEYYGDLRAEAADLRRILKEGRESRGPS